MDINPKKICFNEDEVNEKNFHPKRYTLKNLKKLINSKKIFFAPHGHNHILYDKPNTINIIEEDFKLSRSILKDHKFSNYFFSFPNGRVGLDIYNYLIKKYENIFFFLGSGSINSFNFMHSKRIIRRSDITCFDNSIILILYRISISIIISLKQRAFNIINLNKTLH